MDTTNDTNPQPPTDAPSRPRRTQLRALLGLAVAVPAIGLVSFGVANASEEEEPAADETQEQIVVECGDWTPTPEEITEFNAETDALAAFLAERGIDHTIETAEDGLREVIYDYEDDAANTAVDEFYAERYPMPAEDVAAANADEDALAAFLDERGIAYTREADGEGVNYVAVDENDEAAITAVDEFWAERYPMSAEEVAAANADEDALAAFLDERGITYTREAGPDGINYVAVDENDEAAITAIDEFWSEQAGVECVEVEGDVDSEAAAIEAEMTAELSG